MFGLCPHIENLWTKFLDLECGVVNCPDSCLNPITMPGHRKPCPTLTRKMDTAAIKKLATTTLRKVDAMQFWTGDKMTPKIEDAWAPRKLSAVTRMPCADYAMTMMIRAATGSPFTETTEPEESNKEDEEVGSIKLLPSRAAAAKLSLRRAAATKLSAKRTRLPPRLGYECCNDDCSPELCCSPQMCCSPEMYGCSQMYCSPERAATTERTAANENHERFAYESPLPQMELELRYERRHDGGYTRDVRDLREVRHHVSPPPPGGGLLQGLQGVRSLHQPHNLAARAAEYIVFSAVRDAALQLLTQVPTWSREQLLPVAVLRRGLHCMPQSTASSPSSTPPPTASPGQVCQVSGHKTDPSRPVRRGDSDSRKDHGQTKIPIPELFSKCELMDVIVCAYIHCKIYL